MGRIRDYLEKKCPDIYEGLKEIWDNIINSSAETADIAPELPKPLLATGKTATTWEAICREENKLKPVKTSSKYKDTLAEDLKTDKNPMNASDVINRANVDEGIRVKAGEEKDR